jgi:hypothetical protein
MPDMNEKKMIKAQQEHARHILAKVGLVIISLLWIAYAAITAMMITALDNTAQAGVDPRLTHAVAQGAANVMPLLLSGGVFLAMLTFPIVLFLWWKIKA